RPEGGDRSLHGGDEALGLARLHVLDRDPGLTIGSARIDRIAHDGLVGPDACPGEPLSTHPLAARVGGERRVKGRTREGRRTLPVGRYELHLGRIDLHRSRRVVADGDTHRDGPAHGRLSAEIEHGPLRQQHVHQYLEPPARARLLLVRALDEGLEAVAEGTAEVVVGDDRSLDRLEDRAGGIAADVDAHLPRLPLGPGLRRGDAPRMLRARGHQVGHRVAEREHGAIGNPVRALAGKPGLHHRVARGGRATEQERHHREQPTHGPLVLQSRRDRLHARPLDARPRGLRRPGAGPRRPRHRRRASLPGLAPASALRARAAGRRARGCGHRLHLASRPGRAAHRATRLTPRRLAERRLPRLRRPHGHGRVPDRARRVARARARATHRHPLRRSGALALPSSADRRCAPRTRCRGPARRRARTPVRAPPHRLRARGGRPPDLRSWPARAAVTVLPDVAGVGHNARVAMPPNVHVVSHGPNCLDGVAAAVAVSRYYAGLASVDVRFAGNSEIDSVLRGLVPPRTGDTELWVTDISRREPATDAHLRSLAAGGVRIYWIDHHRTALERFRSGAVDVPFTDRVLSEDFAASRLVYEYLGRRLATEGRAAPTFTALAPLIAMPDDNDPSLPPVPR